MKVIVLFAFLIHWADMATYFTVKMNMYGKSRQCRSGLRKNRRAVGTLQCACRVIKKSTDKGNRVTAGCEKRRDSELTDKVGLTVD